MAKIGFVYSTVDGHTLEICQRLVEVVERAGFEATILELTPDSVFDLAPYDQIVIGASIRYGKHRPEVARFIREHTGLLESKRGAFFSVNAVARKPGGQNSLREVSFLGPDHDSLHHVDNQRTDEPGCQCRFYRLG